ncbi:unnamed protein product [Trichobilharzia regenti]|nr:unnamed protein product [Trichobilharzia regenti]
MMLHRDLISMFFNSLILLLFLILFRWFHVTSDVMVMQPVGSDIHDPQGHSSWPNNYKAITLDSGRWLEIHLGYLNATTHTITGTSNHSDDNNQGGRSKRTDSDYRYPHVNKGILSIMVILNQLMRNMPFIYFEL